VQKTTEEYQELLWSNTILERRWRVKKENVELRAKLEERK